MAVMAQFDFPPLRLAVLNALLAIKEQMAIDPQMWDGCPYDSETVDILKQILDVREVERVVEKTVYIDKKDRGRPRKIAGMSPEDLAELEDEVKGLLKSLKDLDPMEGQLDTNERVQIMKTRASLIDQALKNKERIFNVKNMSEFQTVVIGILDDLVAEEQRETFLDRIEPYRE